MISGRYRGPLTLCHQINESSPIQTKFDNAANPQHTLRPKPLLSSSKRKRRPNYSLVSSNVTSATRFNTSNDYSQNLQNQIEECHSTGIYNFKQKYEASKLLLKISNSVRKIGSKKQLIYDD